MGCEVQKDVTFEDIEAGDVIVMEVFSADKTAFIGDYRGTATHKSYEGITQCWVWHFDGMPGLRSDSKANYRLFRVEPPSAAETELDRLRKMKAGLESMVKERKQAVDNMHRDARYYASVDMPQSAEFHRSLAEKLSDEVRPLEALLHG